MSTLSSRIGFRLMIVAAFCGSPALAEGTAQRRDQIVAHGLSLLDAGRYQEAISAAGPWSHRLKAHMAQRITAAREVGDSEALQSLLQAYLQYYPFGCLDWALDAPKWEAIAREFVALRKASETVMPGSAAAQDEEAVDVYASLKAACSKRDKRECSSLATQIIEKYPSSLFAPAAIWSAAPIVHDWYGSPSGAIYEPYVLKLRASRVPPRSILLVLLAQAQANAFFDGTSGVHFREQVSVCEEIINRSEFEYERRVALLRAAQAGLHLDDPSALLAARQRFREFLVKYPAAGERWEARLGIAKSFLAANELAEAEAEIQRLEAELSGGVASFDGLLTLAPAYLGLGQTYQKLGDVPKMLSTYEKAMKLPSSLRPADLVEARILREEAANFLSAWHLAKGNWSEARRILTACAPMSFCATGLNSLHREHLMKLVHCDLQLGNHRDAARRCLAAARRRESGFSSEVAAVLFQLYRDADQVDDLHRLLDGMNSKQLREASALSQGKASLREGGYVWPLQEVVQLHHFAQHRSYWELIDLIQNTPRQPTYFFEGSSPQWRAQAAAEALSRGSGSAIKALEKAVVQTEDCDWLAYALGRNQLPGSLAALERLLHSLPERKLPCVVRAILMKGSPGEELLQRTAESAEGVCEDLIREQLAQHRREPGTLASWPLPRPKTLPRAALPQE